jgi:hypothetical protein
MGIIRPSFVFKSCCIKARRKKIVLRDERKTNSMLFPYTIYIIGHIITGNNLWFESRETTLFIKFAASRKKSAPRVFYSTNFNYKDWYLQSLGRSRCFGAFPFSVFWRKRNFPSAKELRHLNFCNCVSTRLRQSYMEGHSRDIALT